MAEAERTIGTPDTDTPKASGDELGQSRTGTESLATGRGPRTTADTDDAPSTAVGEQSASGEEQQAQRGHDGTDGQQSQRDPQDAQVPQVQESPEERRGKQRQRKISVLFAVAALAYLLDVISKVIVVAKLEHHAGIDLLGDWLRLEAIRNPGAAFGMGEAFTVIFTAIAAAVIFVIGRLARKLYSLPWAIALGLLLGGALGNLTDRLFRSPGVFEGAVVDFIAPKYFAVFNLADSAIVCGGILIVLLSFRGLDPDGTVHKD